MKIGKYILIGLGVIIIEWIFLSLFASFFNGLSQEGAVVVSMHFRVWYFADIARIYTEEFIGITEERNHVYGDAYREC